MKKYILSLLSQNNSLRKTWLFLSFIGLKIQNHADKYKATIYLYILLYYVICVSALLPSIVKSNLTI